MKNDLSEVFNNTGMVTVFSTDFKRGTQSYVLRQNAGHDAKWLVLIEKLLNVGEAQKLNLHICRRYLLKNGKMVFGWHVGITGNLDNSYAAISHALRNTKPLKASKPLPTITSRSSLKIISSGVGSDGKPYSVEEMPLPHVSGTDLNIPNNKGRGAKGAK